MENSTSFFDKSPEANGSNHSARYLLPSLAVIYTPIIVVELLVGLVSNLLLICVLLKGMGVVNNINIYLCSMAVNNLLSLFPLLTLMVTTATQRWVFGQTMCTLNQVMSYLAALPNIFIPAFISRERYRAVLHFFEWKPYTKRTYIEVGIVWMAAVGAGVMGLLQGGQIVGETDDVISCYAPSRWLKGTFSIYNEVSAVMFIFITASSLLFGLVHYAYIFRQLHNMKKNSRYASNLSLKHNYQDVPIDWNSELKALNSMACMCVHLICCTKYYWRSTRHTDGFNSYCQNDNVKCATCNLCFYLLLLRANYKPRGDHCEQAFQNENQEPSDIAS